MKTKPSKLKIAIIIMIALTLVLTIVLPYPVSDMTTYALGTLVCVALMRFLDFGGIKNAKLSVLSALFVATPAMLIAINNFPWMAILAEKPKVDLINKDALTAIILCLLVAIFEETMFRAFVAKQILKNVGGRGDYFKKIILSGLIFGLYHLLNIIFGASVGYTLLQVTYTTLIGSMLCVVYDKSQRLWLCVLIHFIYNVGGDSVRLLGIKNQWVLPEIVLTAIVSVLVFAFYLAVLLKSKTTK